MAYPRSRFTTEEALQAHSRLDEDKFIGDGILGYREMKQEAGNI